MEIGTQSGSGGLDERPFSFFIEPWQVISPEGMIRQHTELPMVAKARFGKAAEMRPRLLNLIHERLAEAGMALAA